METIQINHKIQFPCRLTKQPLAEVFHEITARFTERVVLSHDDNRSSSCSCSTFILSLSFNDLLVESKKDPSSIFCRQQNVTLVHQIHTEEAESFIAILHIFSQDTPHYIEESVAVSDGGCDTLPVEKKSRSDRSLEIEQNLYRWFLMKCWKRSNRTTEKS